jgi:hypothetical protein
MVGLIGLEPSSVDCFRGWPSSLPNRCTSTHVQCACPFSRALQVNLVHEWLQVMRRKPFARRPAGHPLNACFATSAARLVLSRALGHGVPRRLLPAGHDGHVGGAPFDELWRTWESVVRWQEGVRKRACACILRPSLALFEGHNDGLWEAWVAAVSRWEGEHRPASPPIPAGPPPKAGRSGDCEAEN